LAELSHSENAEIDEKLDGDTLNHFEKIILQRKKILKYSRKMEAPQFAEKAIVYMRDMIPSTSNILKIPQRGPFQILEIKERNVVLLDPETGQTVNTHLELIRPLDLKEFRLFLNKKWDLNTHHQKAIDKRLQPGIFDEPRHPIPLEQAIEAENPEEIEDEIDLEELFYPPPANAGTLTVPDQLTDSTPPIEPEMDPPEAENSPQAPAAQEITDEFDDTQVNNLRTSEMVFINSLHAHRDLSKSFRDTLRSRKEKLITFFLSKHDQYIKVPAVGEHEESDID
jgi:hypothetical protein